MIVRLLAAMLLAATVVNPARADGARVSETAPEALFLLNDKRIVESSGLAVSRQHRLLWTHNDAGHDATVFALEPSGAIHATVNVAGARAEDWEDIAVATIDGRNWVYLADVGDAYLARNERGIPYRRRFEVVRFEEPGDIPVEEKVRVEVTVYSIQFKDREGVNVEAMAVRNNGAIVLIEKLEDEGNARVWTIDRPLPGRNNVPEVIGEVPLVGVSGADVSPDGERLVLRTADTAYVYDVQGGLADGLQEPPDEVSLPSQPRGEGVAFTSDGNGLVISSEGSAQSVWFLPLAKGATLTLASDGLQETADEASTVWDASEPMVVWALMPLVAAGIGIALALLFALGPRRRRSSESLQRVLRPERDTRSFRRSDDCF